MRGAFDLVLFVFQHKNASPRPIGPFHCATKENNNISRGSAVVGRQIMTLFDPFDPFLWFWPELTKNGIFSITFRKFWGFGPVFSASSKRVFSLSRGSPRENWKNGHFFNFWVIFDPIIIKFASFGKQLAIANLSTPISRGSAVVGRQIPPHI